MKALVIILASVFAFSGGLAFAHGYKRHYHRYYMHHAWGGPNGTSGGRTSLSGTGSSRFGGQVPGATGHY
jgi:hypothetical protein